MTETTAVDGMITGPIGLALVVAGEREGIHGHEHWRRVGENAIDLAHEEGVSCHVALLFAILHDCRRENDGHDPGHGPRAAELAESLGHEALGITPDELRTLTYAMHHHDRGQVTDDPLVGVCWDSDRLDLIRVGTRPDPALLSTKSARDPVRIALCSDHRAGAPTWERLVKRLADPGRLTMDEQIRRFDANPRFTRAKPESDAVTVTPRRARARVAG